MNRILLTTTAMVAFAGAATAEGINFSGEAEIGMNDNEGFFYSADLAVAGSRELNSGFEAGFSVDFVLDLDQDAGAATNDGDNPLYVKGYELYLKSENAGMYFGDTDTAADALFNDNFKTVVYGDKFGKVSEGSTNFGVLRGEYTVSGWDIAASANVFNDGTEKDLGGIQAAVAGSFNVLDVAFAVQAEDTDTSSDGFIGVHVGGTFSSFDVSLGYINNTTADTDNMLLKASYGLGDVTIAGFFANEFDDTTTLGLEAEYTAGPLTVMGQVKAETTAADVETTTFLVDGSYDMENGLVMYAGAGVVGDDQHAYVGGEYDLGGDATLTGSYAWDNATAYNKEIGDAEFKEGATVAVTFEF